MTMAGEPASRPLLPHAGQSFTFATQTPQFRDAQQRNYVFVDEHNRHKRLKVMRACEGCRRRKIKCDSATTNTWPCGSCTRLKLACVPPTLNFEQEASQPGMIAFDMDHHDDYPTIPIGHISDYAARQHFTTTTAAYPPTMASVPMQQHMGYASNMPMFQQQYMTHGAPSLPLQYMPMNPAMLQTQNLSQPHLLQQNLPQPPITPQTDTYYNDVKPPPPAKDGAWLSPSLTSPSISSSSLADGLSEAMGDLKISLTGSSKYIADKFREAQQTPLDEVEVTLPIDNTADLRIRIPSEMMPADSQALTYIDYFFDNIHPYVPVLNRTRFMREWQESRDLISPLLLEGIFACATAALGDENSARWLALSARHEEKFKEAPRLSTVQAMLILLKAREAAPRRGYFYRSWMTLVNTIAMAKDLELNNHLEQHEAGESCVSVYDCVCKTRCWQLCYVLEAMIGGPQGRFDLNVSEDSVDFSPPTPLPGIDDQEYRISRQLLYNTHMVKNIRTTMSLYSKLRKTHKHWVASQDYENHDADFPIWLDSLPKEFRITLPTDGSTPRIPNSYVANMHCYYYLSVIMHHRPKIQYMEDNANFGAMREQLLVCHDAAKKMCRIQESILENYDLPAFVWMQRGISFTVYCVLSCTMLHLVSITSPDPALNGEARDYFVRHMRILEKISPAWPMPEAKAQVDSLRQAFSADTSRPFELKPNFPYGSPAMQETPSPLMDNVYRSQIPAHQLSQQHPAGSIDMIANSTASADPSIANLSPEPMMPQQQWNPSKIFEQWNVAFGTPNSSAQSQPSPPSSADLLGPDPPAIPMQPLQRQTSNPLAGGGSYSPSPGYGSTGPYMSAPSSVPNNMTTSMPQMGLSPGTTMPSMTQAMASNYVTPSMWQDVVASSFGGGVKRSWESRQSGIAQDIGLSKRQR